jgi:hypothetical protein
MEVAPPLLPFLSQPLRGGAVLSVTRRSKCTLGCAASKVHLLFPPILFPSRICITRLRWLHYATVPTVHAFCICMVICIVRWAQPYGSACICHCRIQGDPFGALDLSFVCHVMFGVILFSFIYFYLASIKYSLPPLVICCDSRQRNCIGRKSEKIGRMEEYNL